MDDCFFVYLLATFRRCFYVVGVQIISSHIVYETNQEEEIKKWLSLNRARNTKHIIVIRIIFRNHLILASHSRTPCE